jgi:DUF917 family protein
VSWTLGPDDLPDLARGAALLGTGGGGDPHVGRLMVAEAMRRHGPVTVLDPDEVADDAFVIPTAMMGAPTVMIEKIPRGDEAVLSLRALERHLGRTADATMPIECGGINSMIPLVVAATTGLPVVDADGMGRAFPELQMETFGVYGVSGSPMAVSGDHGELVLIDTGTDNKRMEWLARGATIRMGGAALIAEYAMTGAEIGSRPVHLVRRHLDAAHRVPEREPGRRGGRPGPRHRAGPDLRAGGGVRRADHHRDAALRAAGRRGRHLHAGPDAHSGGPRRVRPRVLRPGPALRTRREHHP